MSGRRKPLTAEVDSPRSPAGGAVEAVAPAAVAGSARREFPASWEPALVVGLQRAAGNSAVSSLLRTKRSPLIVQRDEPTASPRLGRGGQSPDPLLGDEKRVQVLRFSNTGKPLTTAILVAWALKAIINEHGVTLATLKKRLLHSHEFTGSDDDRDRAVDALLLAEREDPRLHYEWAREGRHWEEAARTCNVLTDDEVLARLNRLTKPDLTSLAKASERIHGPVGRVATAAEYRSLIGENMKWSPYAAGPESEFPVTTFTDWARAPSEPPPLAISAETSLNCWEAILFAGHRSGVLSWERIHSVYSGSEAGWETRLRALLGGAARAYGINDPQTPRPALGNVVLFDGLEHVALATGLVDSRGRSEVISFWPPPTKAFDRGGPTVDKVKLTTIEELNAFWVSNHRPPFSVTFGPPGW